MDDFNARLVSLSSVQEHIDALIELEMIPIAKAMQGLELRFAKRVDIKWLIRPEAGKMYATLKDLQEDDVGAVMMQFFADPVLQKVWPIAQDYHTADIVEKLKTEWQSRTEKLYLQRFVSAQQVKDKMFALNMIKTIYADRSEEVYIPDYENPSPNMRFFFNVGGVACLAQGDITAVKGKAKGGKSTFLKILTAAAISDSGECCGIKRNTVVVDGEEKPADPLRVLYFDTEQSKCTTDKMLRGVVKMAGLPKENTDRLRIVNTRRMKTANRMARFEEELTIGQGYDIVILDGVKDIVKNINDPEETDTVVQMLLTIAQDRNIALIVVLHENPGKDTDKMRGWIGTEVTNKAFMVWQVAASKTKGKYNINPTECREKEPPAYAYQWNEDGEIEEAIPDSISEGPGSGSQADKKEETERKNFLQFCKAWDKNPTISMTQEMIVQEHLSLGTLSETTCKRRINTYAAQHLLRVEEIDKSKRYSLSAKGKEKRDALLAEPAPIVGANSALWSPADNDNKDMPF